uniref:Uncharacterized protein n=1 Tax=Nelumbo nucifera TaxID=4432 RepID=A0A822YV51_NELNU|nr:TPA_asm: hypothetical protein HUJ06_005266 [Nelumbo nucifera]
METQSNRIMMREKLGFSGILKSALTIPYKSPSFLIFAFTTSLPLFFTLLLHDIIVQRSLIEASAAMRSLSFGYTIQFHFPSSVYFYDWSSPLETAGRLARSMSHRIIQLGLLRLVPLHLFYLLNTIAVVHSASLIYTGETPVSLKEMLQIPNSPSRGETDERASDHIYLCVSDVFFNFSGTDLACDLLLLFRSRKCHM